MPDDCFLCNLAIGAIALVTTDEYSYCDRCGKAFYVEAPMRYEGLYQIKGVDTHVFVLLDRFECPKCGQNMTVFHARCGANYVVELRLKRRMADNA